MSDFAPDAITRAVQGDIAAFEEIYRAHSRMVYAVALRMLGQAEDAEEVVQDVFIAVHRALQGFDGRSSLKTWIYRITVNMSLNALRRLKGRRREMALPEGMEFEDSRQMVQESVEREHLEDKARTLLQGLPADQRACLVLRVQEGLSYEEISRTLGININTVRSRLKRAREAAVKAAGQRRAEP
ncbi:MAG: RNA polymerase sigma factor [Candidatus Omnitrophica bacterium]|nr:RNA polymerase sigma factor [Candidatus Omnitrophota bacterium]